MKTILKIFLFSPSVFFILLLFLFPATSKKLLFKPKVAYAQSNQFIVGLRFQPSYNSSEISNKMTCFQNAGINTLYFQTDHNNGHALYKSTLKCFPPYLSGTYEPLKQVIDEGHSRSMKVFALLDVAYLGWEACPEYNIRAKGYSEDWFNFNDPTARDFLAAVVSEIVSNYNVDGVLLDYIRWKTTFVDDDPIFFSSASISLAVKAVYNAIKQIKPNAIVAASVFRTTGDAAAAGQIWKDWLNGGYIDYVTPMTYNQGGYHDNAGVVSSAIENWKTTGFFPEKIIPRLGLASFDGTERAKTLDEVKVQVDLCLNSVTNPDGTTRLKGITFFDDGYLCRAPEIIEYLANAFKSTVTPTPILTPGPGSRCFGLNNIIDKDDMQTWANAYSQVAGYYDICLDNKINSFELGYLLIHWQESCQ